MSTIRYSKLFSVEVLHDYYLFDGRFLEDYNILNDLDFIPTPATATLLRNLKCVYKKNARGFDVFIKVGNRNQTFVYVDPEVKFQFLISVKNPYFFNFTNLRLTEQRGKLYRFANTATADDLSFPFLHKNIRGFEEGNSFDFGDLTLDGTILYESIGNGLTTFDKDNFFQISYTTYLVSDQSSNLESPILAFRKNGLPPNENVLFTLKDDQNRELDLGVNPNNDQDQSFGVASEEGMISHSINLSKFQLGNYILEASYTLLKITEQTNLSILNKKYGYVSIQDRINWQYPNFRFQKEGLTPNEVVTFELKDENGMVQQLGNIPNTGKPQAQIVASEDGKVDHVIDLSKFTSGVYTLTTSSSNLSTETKSFFLLDPTINPNAFGVIELYANAISDEFNFLNHAVSNESSIQLDGDQAKTFQIRFKNRSTVWNYFNANGSPKTDQNTSPRRALTKQFSNFTLGDEELPDPSIAFIYPKLNDAQEVENIFSEIYLSQ